MAWFETINLTKTLRYPFINVLVDEVNKLKDNDTVKDIDEVDDYLNPKTISETNENSSNTSQGISDQFI